MRRLYYEAENELGEIIETTDWKVTKEFNQYEWKTKLYTIIPHDEKAEEWNEKRREKIWKKA